MIEIPSISRVQANNRHSNKISWYRRNALDMVRQIDLFLEDHANIKLPQYYSDLKSLEVKSEIYQYDSYGDALELEYNQLVKLRYDLLSAGRAIYALFDNNGIKKTQMLACWYSKNRLDPVWNYRKSQIIRKVYKEFLLQSNLHNTHTAAHLVLTLPHKEGTYKNSKFYASELVKDFNKLRKTDVWKQYIDGGEYGVEVKKSKNNGLHIHIHSLVFLEKSKSINEARAAIQTEWELLTGAKMLHLETLYFYKKDPTGKKVLEWAVDKKTGKDLNIQVPKKFYINRYDAPVDPEEKINEYLYGVMECIKYHFKNDCLKTESGNYDIPLMIEVLNNTKGARLYSRFGILYKEEKLNFNRLEKKNEEQTETELDEEVSASTDNVMPNLVNPFTKEIAKENEYEIVIAKPENIKHFPKNSATPNEPEIYTTEIFFRTKKELTLKGILKLMAKGIINELFEHDDYIRYLNKKYYIVSKYKYRNTQIKIFNN